MDEDYAMGISMLAVIGSMCLCCSGYFFYVLYVKNQTQEEEHAESLV